MHRLTRMLGARTSGGWTGWLAFVAVFAVSVAGVASGPVFLESVGDAIARDAVVSQPPLARAFVDSFDEGFREGSTLVADSLAGISGLDRGPVTYSVGANRTAASNGVQASAAQIRLVYHEGGLDQLDPVATSGAPGVWIGERLAADLGVAAGDRFQITDPVWTLDVPVAGVFRDLDPADLGSFWSGLPPELRPRFDLVFKTVEPQLVLADEETFYLLVGGLAEDESRESSISLGVDDFPPLSGRAWWQTTPFDGATGADLLRTADELFELQTALVDPTDPLGGPLTAGGLPRVRIDSELFGIAGDIDTAKTRIEPSVGSVQITIGLVGLVVVGLGAWFVARRRRTEIRMWSIEGRSPWTLGVGASVGAAPAALVGAAMGALAVPFLVRAFGPAATLHPEALSPVLVIAVTGAGLVITGGVTGWEAVRVLDVERRSVAPRWVWDLVLYGIAATLAVQLLIGDPVDPAGRVNLAAVLFPVIGTAALVVLGLRVFSVAAVRWRTTGADLPTPLFLAWRRVTAALSGHLGIVIPIAVAIGTAALASSLATSLTVSLDAKSLVEVGSDVRATLPRTAISVELPSDYSLVRSGTATSQGREPVMLVVIDPDTYPDAVPWDPVLGEDLATVLDLLADGTGERVPTLVAGRTSGFPDEGSRRTQDMTLAYEVVGELDAIPQMASRRTTMLMRRDTIVAWAQANADISGWGGLQLEAGGDPVNEDDLFLALQAWLVSTDSPGSVSDFLAGIGQPTDLIETRAGALDDAAFSAPRWAFDYLRLLAFVSIPLAIVVFAFAIVEERRRIAVAHALLRRMGVHKRSASAALAIEVTALVVLAGLLGMAAAAVLTITVTGQLDPLPRLLPALKPVIATGAFGLAGLIAIAGAAVVWWAARRSASRADIAEVLRVG